MSCKPKPRPPAKPSSGAQKLQWRGLGFAITGLAAAESELEQETAELARKELAIKTGALFHGLPLSIWLAPYRRPDFTEEQAAASDS